MDEKIGKILIDMKLITQEQLEEALRAQMETNLKSVRKFKLGEILLFSEVITLPQLQGALRQQTLKANQSRDHAMDAKKKARESDFGSLRSDAKKLSEQEDTFLGRLKSFIKKKP